MLKNIKPIRPGHVALFHSLLWAFLIPQALLVMINIKGWMLIGGEAGNDELKLALGIFAFQLLMLTAIPVMYFFARTGRIGIGWKLQLLSLCAHAVYMWLFLIYIDDVIPDSIQPWILDEGNVGRWNITLMMPAAFVSLYALTKSIFDNIPSKGVSVTLILGMIFVPFILYVLVLSVQPLAMGRFSEVITIVFFSISITAFLAAMIRMFDNIIFSESTVTFSEKHYVLALILGMAAPLGGLYLNKVIPFPTDFQITEVYVFTVLNGLILMFKPNVEAYASLRLFFRCLTWPFIAYFFFVFLPFLPLSVFAIIALGAGFLMLTPLALGLFQTRVTFIDYGLVRRQRGNWQALSIAIVGCLLVPLFLVTQILLDKRALDAGLAYFYANDMSQESLSDSQIERMAKTLIQLRDRKDNAQLPYIAGVYNYLVFGDMVLPDAKIERMYSWLTNEKMPEGTIDFFGFGDHRSNWRWRGRPTPPQTDVSIRDIERQVLRPGQAQLLLTLLNNTEDTHSLFVESMHIPEGVFVTDLSLKIDGQWVPARVFDRKTAIWVFQKITEVRRDPALMIYIGQHQAQLRVYPFPEKGVREVKITFEYHPMAEATVQIGKRRVQLNDAAQSFAVMDTTGAILNHEDIAKSAFIRKPYIHFILDYSAGSKLSAQAYLEKISRVSQILGITDLTLSAANIQVERCAKKSLLDLENVGEIKEQIDGFSIKEQSGFWTQNILAREITHIRSTYEDFGVDRVPIFVVLAGDKFDIEEEVSLDPWHWLLPDLTEWYVFYKGKLLARNFMGKAEALVDAVPLKPVLVLNTGSERVAVGTSASSVLDFEGVDIQIVSKSDNRFKAVRFHDPIEPISTTWLQASKAWVYARKTALNPALLEAERSNLLELGRSNSVLLPTTAMIVVESDSQWRMLEQKEKQSLGNKNGLEFDEQQASEPSWWLMLMGVLIFVYVAERRGRTLHLGCSG